MTSGPSSPPPLRAPSRPSRLPCSVLRRPSHSGLRSQVSGFSSRGFTLVELLIGASLSAAVLAAVLSSYIYLGRSLGRLANQQTLETQARRTLGFFTQDIQQATGLTTITTAPTSPAANRVDLTVPTATGATNTITYYYNRTAAPAVVMINTTAVTMPATSLTRCVDNGTTVTSLTLLRNISDGNAGTPSDLTLRYYDASGREYETATLTARSYLIGIKQVSLAFAARIVTVNAGTSTPVQRETTGRLALRNRGFLP